MPEPCADQAEITAEVQPSGEGAWAALHEAVSFMSLRTISSNRPRKL
jgi:hypothetical protein